MLKQDDQRVNDIASSIKASSKMFVASFRMSYVIYAIYYILKVFMIFLKSYLVCYDLRFPLGTHSMPGNPKIALGHLLDIYTGIVVLDNNLLLYVTWDHDIGKIYNYIPVHTALINPVH